MEKVYNDLASRICNDWIAMRNGNPEGHPARLLIALAGPPGSGKTTVANHVVALVNARLPSCKAVVVSMDGFHLPCSALSAMPNSAEAFARRGSPWTFDAAAAVALVRRVAQNGTPPGAARTSVSVPTFDHAIKDPVPDGMIIDSTTDIVIFEGNYLLCDEESWAEIGRLVDQRWLVTVAPELARARVAARHVAAGIEPDVESGLRRADGNDLINGRYVVEHSKNYDLAIESIEEVMF